jgi:hypothetical protein
MTKDVDRSLTGARGMGGIIAQDGFDYQLWDGLARVPTWLANPAFEALIFEGYEDLEARFFAPHSPRLRLLERFQAKSGDLAKGDVRKVFESFAEFDKAHPRSTRVHTLVTPRLPSDLRWVARDSKRVRNARPFYAPFPDLLEVSDDQLLKNLQEEFGDELGRFVAEFVEVSERSISDPVAAQAAFASALRTAFPGLDVSGRSEAKAFEALSELARRTVGSALSRPVLISTVEEAIGESLGIGGAVPVHVRSDRNGVDEKAIEIDASEFSGGPAGFPLADRWSNGLIQPLDETSRWLRGAHLSRLKLGGSYRLTAAFALGWSFRSAIGFELEIPTRDGGWATDERPSPGEFDHDWMVTSGERLVGDRLVATVGILRNPAPDLASAGTLAQEELLSIYSGAALTDGRAAQAGVSVVKRAVGDAVARLRPKQIDLYVAGPAAFAVALGHRWNAMPPTQLFEFNAVHRSYSPTALIG